MPVEDTMSYVSPGPGRVFHTILRSCLAEQRRPTENEIVLIASRIWQDGFASEAGYGWAEVVPGSSEYKRTIEAAHMALGIFERETA